MNQTEIVRKEQNQIAASLMLYPAVYILLSVVLASGRLVGFIRHKDVTPVWLSIGEIFYACEGWCNVLLYTTREGVIPWTWTGWRHDVLALMEVYHVNDHSKKD